ncbi:methyltransferase [Arthrobacter ginkgonis]|uniref:Methyltransferase n=1 Tax=Arthrobacter ginkgonis TaxID=1630594 RepID=A0ABP7C245_9MICC
MSDHDFSRIPDAPQSHDQALLDALAADLHAAGYTHDGVSGLLGEETHAALNRDQLVPALLVVRRLLAEESPAPIAAITAFWMLGLDLPATVLDAALPRTSAAGLLVLGLAEAGPDIPDTDGSGFGGPILRSAVDLRPHASDADAELWVASDLGAHQRAGVLRHDHVLGIGQASLTLAQTTVRPQVRTALDLGTGCGIQAFHLLSHVRRVVATDISERALAFARFNLLLNHRALDIDPADPGARVDLRLGSLLDPVAGERFDLVVSNPPFVITPRTAGETEADRFTYRDGGLPGDHLVAGLVAGLPDLLVPGGIAQMLANWEITEGNDDGGDWSAGPRSWVPEGIEAWFIQRETVSPSGYAETWLRDASEARDPDLYAARYADYLEDFASRRVQAVGFGMVWLRRPAVAGTAPFGQVFEEITYPIEQPIGPHLAAAVERADTLAGLEAAPGRHRLDAAHLLVADDVTEERHQRPGAEHPGVILLRQGAGLRRTTLLSTELAGFVSACDGDLSAGQIARALAALLDRDAEELVPALLDEVEDLVRGGFLLKMRNNR